MQICRDVVNVGNRQKILDINDDVKCCNKMAKMTGGMIS